MHPSITVSLTCAFVLLIASASAFAEGLQGYYMYPDLNSDTIVFAAEGDIFSVAANGGMARRLTTHEDEEQLPKISPDGMRIAFTGSYGGNPDVCVMPIGGGTPRRLTFGPSSNMVVGWRGNQSVLYRTRGGPNRSYEIWAVSVEGGLPQRLPVGMASLASIHEQGDLVAFNRAGRMYRTWKRYAGGTNENIWMGSLADGGFRKLTDFPGTDAFPMWHGDRIYFLSDRTGVVNIWSIGPDSRDLEQHTEFDTYDARWPSMRDGRIVFHQFGEVKIYDIATDEVQAVNITIPSDRRRAYQRITDPGDYLVSVDLGPEGERLALEIRGHVHVLPHPRGRAVTVSQNSRFRDKTPVLSHDGKLIAAWSTDPGTEQLFIYPADGKGERTQLTNDRDAWHFAPVWSPDGKKIAFADNTHMLHWIDVETRAVTEVERSKSWETTIYRWSPDSRWLAYVLVASNDMRVIRIHDSQTGATHTVTDPMFETTALAWDPDGKMLFYLSERMLQNYLGPIDFQTVLGPAAVPFALLLRDDVVSPLLPPEMLSEEQREKLEKAEKENGDAEEDQEGEDDETEREETEEDGEDEEKQEPIEIDFEGIRDRVVVFPVRPRYLAPRIEVGSGKIFYLETEAPVLREDSRIFEEDDEPKNVLWAYDYTNKDFAKREESVSVKGMTDFRISGNGEKLLVRKKNKYFVVKSEGTEAELKEEDLVDFSRISVRIDPAEEWAQILHDTFLFQKYFFYAPNFVGHDWTAIYERYKKLLPRIATRRELNDVIGQMIAELGTGHTYVWGRGEEERGESVSVGSLGADFEREESSGLLRFAKIYRGYPWHPDYHSPLRTSQAGIEEGHYLHAINGTPITATVSPDELLLDQAEQMVELAVSEDGTTETLRLVTVRAMRDDQRLRYYDWVESNRAYVETQSGGRFGYIHLPNMGGFGLVMFFRYYFPQVFDKEGLVVDARFNGGGFVSQLILERLTREVLLYRQTRHSELHWRYPSYSFRGPMVALCNQWTGSDGDIFSMAWKQKGRGPLIGMRTWGGVVGIRGDKDFVDKGMTTQPEFSTWHAAQGWVMENVGVEPDIEIELTPDDELAGRDPQLDAAIEYLKAELERNPEKYAPPELPAFPDHSIPVWRERYRDYLDQP